MGTNWSRVGSAQQYQGSFRYGTVTRVAGTGGAAVFTSFHILLNVSVRLRFSFSLDDTTSCNSSHSPSTSGSTCFQGWTSALASNGPTALRTSFNSSNREPAV